ncbi:MAG: peptidoglycan-binding protein, partial [Candidatus Sungbacteria bacterium]|nr:peptidoglycan-binding protein [Candidatus Sungbacteria bacterium]
FDFVPSSPMKSDTSYMYNVLSNLRNTNGLALRPFSATFRTAVSSTSTDSWGTVYGTIKDTNGNPLAGAGVHMFKKDFSVNYEAVSDSFGSFKVLVFPGTYMAEVYPPYSRSDLLRIAVPEFSINAGQKINPNFQFLAPVKIISGTIIFADGKPVTDAIVGAYSKDTGQWSQVTVDGNGRYSLTVGGGTWIVGINPKDGVKVSWTWSGPYAEVGFTKDTSTESKTVNITVTSANILVRIFAADSSGSAVAGASVTLDTISTAQSTSGEHVPPQYGKTDSSGKVEFLVPKGTYYARAHIGSEFGYIDPPEQIIITPSLGSIDMRLVFNRSEITSTVDLKGIVRLPDGTGTNAFIWLWSEKGRSEHIQATSAGTFALRVSSNDIWHIGAGQEIGGYAYKANEIAVPVVITPVSVELVLQKFTQEQIPPTVQVIRSTSEQIVAQTNDGTKLTIPPSTVAGTGSVNVEIKPTIEIPSQAGAKVVSTGYDVSIRDSLGKEIKQFDKEIEIIIPYKAEDLKDFGVSEDNLMPSYFDDVTERWVTIDNYTIDKTKKIIIARVKHLTRFAIVAAADIVPPAPPKSVLARALGAGKIEVIWMNPSVDFDHAKIYRSIEKGALGSILNAEITTAIFVDTSVINGVTYYYTVRAVDPAGNESANVDQVKAVAAGTGASAPVSKTALTLARDLKLGSKGTDVSTLQSLLIRENVYPEALVTGYFGAKTQAAVIRFQEKYTSTILVPAGLTKGSGFVGRLTRQKLNELLSK